MNSSARHHTDRAATLFAAGDESYGGAISEVEAARGAGATLGEIAKRMGKSEAWLSQVMKWAKSQDTELPWTGPRGEAREASTATKVLTRSTPEQVKRVLAELPEKQLDAIAREATDALVSRAQAKRAERRTSAESNERWDPGESWADNYLIALNRKARELQAHIDCWGLVLGSMTPEMALEYAEEAERIAAEARAALQERARDEAMA